MSGLARTLFTQRLGVTLQQQRQRRLLTQETLAERAGLSLKYVGEVERGEANATLHTLERIAIVLGWDPWTLFAIDQQPISQPVHQLILAEVRTTRGQLQRLLDWLSSLDPARRDTTSSPPPIATIGAALRPRGRGRPRKAARHASRR